jgi:hypothetical protein
MSYLALRVAVKQGCATGSEDGGGRTGDKSASEVSDRANEKHERGRGESGCELSRRCAAFRFQRTRGALR